MPDYLFEATSVCGFGLITSAQNGLCMFSTGNLQKKKGTVIKWTDSANVLFKQSTVIHRYQSWLLNPDILKKNQNQGAYPFRLVNEDEIHTQIYNFIFSTGAWHANHRLLYQIVRFPAKMQSHSWREQEKTISKPRFHIRTFIILYTIGNSNDVSTSTHGSRGKHLACRLSWCQSGINNFVKELSQDMWGKVEEEFLLPWNK